MFLAAVHAVLAMFPSISSSPGPSLIGAPGPEQRPPRPRAPLGVHGRLRLPRRLGAAAPSPAGGDALRAPLAVALGLPEPTHGLPRAAAHGHGLQPLCHAHVGARKARGAHCKASHAGSEAVPRAVGPRIRLVQDQKTGVAQWGSRA